VHRSGADPIRSDVLVFMNLAKIGRLFDEIMKKQEFI